MTGRRCEVTPLGDYFPSCIDGAMAGPDACVCPGGPSGFCRSVDAGREIAALRDEVDGLRDEMAALQATVQRLEHLLDTA